MRKKWFCKFVIALIAITGIFWYVKVANSAFPEGRDFTVIPDGAEYAPGQLLVRFAPKTNGMQRSTAEKNQILNSLGGGIIKHTYKIPGLTLVKLPAGLTVRDALKTFNKEIGILYAEPDYRIYFAKTPNDPCFTEGELWGMHNTGQIPPGGTPDADIDAPEAWEIATDSDVIVAVIDTGTDCDHEDLEDNMWVNTDEYPGDWNEDERPGIEFVDDDDDGLIDEDSQGRDYREQGWNNDLKEDDDENGYIDDINGWDFGYGDNEPEDSYPHGTHVAGTVGAVGDNDKGVVGVCWDVSIMNLKIFHSGTTGPNALLNAAVEAIEYADDKGASVLNCSFMIGWSQSLEDVIDEADANGVLIVAAAGNGDFDIDEPPLITFPACDDSNNIIGVMATDQNDNRSTLPLGASNWGATSVDLSAPGSGILSCLNQQGEYFPNSGTSMATPHVSGACALVWAVKPELSHLEVKQIVLDSVDDVNDLNGRCVTGGRLNLDRALALATESCISIFDPNYDEWVSVGRPDCWCYPRQCRGDADDRYQGKQKYWVSTYDLDVLVAAWSKPFEEIEGETITVGGEEVELICADFDHLPQGKNDYRVSNNDLDILIANWQDAGLPAPTCLVDCQPEAAGSPVKQHTLEEFVIWLEEVWLSDKELRKAIGNRRWKEFLESLIEEWLSE